MTLPPVKGVIQISVSQTSMYTQHLQTLLNFSFVFTSPGRDLGFCISNKLSEDALNITLRISGFRASFVDSEANGDTSPFINCVFLVK